MQNDSVKERFNLDSEIARIHSELGKCRIQIKKTGSALLVALCFLFILFAATYYLSNFPLSLQQITALPIEAIILVFLMTSFSLLLIGIVLILVRKISQLEKMARQIELEIERLKNVTRPF